MKCLKTMAIMVALAGGFAAANDDKEGEGKGKKGASLRGQIKVVDATKSTITLAVREGNDDMEDPPLVEKTFPVAKDASIMIDGKAAKLGELKPASQAVVNLSEDRKTVTRITVGRGKGGDNEGEKSQPKREEKGKGEEAAGLANAAKVVRSVQSGPWSAPATWEGQVPAAGVKVLIREGHAVRYDIKSDAVIRSLHVAGTLFFAHDKDTRPAMSS